VTTTVGDFRVGGQGGHVGGGKAGRRRAARSVRTAVARARRTVHGVRDERDRGEENGWRTDHTATQNGQSKYDNWIDVGTWHKRSTDSARMRSNL